MFDTVQYIETFLFYRGPTLGYSQCELEGKNCPCLNGPPCGLSGTLRLRVSSKTDL